MNLEVKDIPTKILPLLQSLRNYLGMICIVAFVGIYGFLVFRINSLAASEPSETAVTEKLKTVQRPRIDEEAVKKIERLEAQNIEVRSLFNKARQNPFTEQ